MTTTSLSSVARAEELSVFKEWSVKGVDDLRSLSRARLLAEGFGVEISDLDMLKLGVVGSKGKGTCAMAASLLCSTAGLDVVTVTSPGFRSNRERIRRNGQELSMDVYMELLLRAKTVVDEMEPTPGEYLAPTGVFSMLGAIYAANVGADVLIAEAGRGGISDEISLLDVDLLAVTPIFAEHVGQLGANPKEIAGNKVRAAGRQASILSLPQRDDVSAGMHLYRNVEMLDPNDPVMELVSCVGGLNTANAGLGMLSASRLLELNGWSLPSSTKLKKAMDTLVLPGRLSVLDGGQLILDAAIDATGIAAAIRFARSLWSSAVELVLLCLPDDKNIDAVEPVLSGLPVAAVTLDAQHLHFEDPPAWISRSMSMENLSSSSLPPKTLAVGTISFVAAMLDMYDVNCSTSYMVADL